MEIISRSTWKARPPEDVVSTTWGKRTEFIVHYSDTPAATTINSIQNFHMDTRGWSDIGYNFVVDEQGRIYMGRGWLTVGAQATGHNTSGIGVCYISFDRPGVTDVTEAAKRAIRWLYDEANRRRYAAGYHSTLTIKGHRDVGNTDCPGDELYAWVHAGLPMSSPVPVPPYDGSKDAIMTALPTLRHGSEGDVVTVAQSLLRLRGYDLGSGGVDGLFYTDTEHAVTKFQTDHGLTHDGIVGPHTWSVLLLLRDVA